MLKILTLMGCGIAIALTAACSIEPNGERPGLGVSGEVHKQAVEDWSFTDDAYEIFLETATPYWIPHSVTIRCATVGDKFYVAATNPHLRSWTANVSRDPNVRLKIKGKVYEQKLVPITDVEIIASIDAGYAKKYNYADVDVPGDVNTYGYWQVVDRGRE